MLRTTPWFTDGAVTFLTGLLKWKAALLEATGGSPTVLEFGGGNSTLYFLQKGLSVVSVEADPRWRERLARITSELGFHVCPTTAQPCDHVDRATQPVLQIVAAERLDAVPPWVLAEEYLVTLNDGIDRWASLEALLARQDEDLLIVDNVEYAADWGTLPIGSGYPERAAAWRRHLRDPARDWLLFEQPEGRDARGTPDLFGIEREARKITGVTWRKDSVLATCGVTVTGTCVTSPASKDDVDLEDLRARCPYPTDATSFEGRSLPRSYG